ncbi:MAG: cell division protein ZapA [Candidatus Nitronauta litoralis]|uniref:Cell division protein ZapA n=1 Tax=Candidatus Nitronauta litoralis TaxID=2705533 RepID=A0A7T0FZ74_9BACT|nr:MAG: cell division protein ZapA [Candidatus Nitronauta litoralis]
MSQSSKIKIFGKTYTVKTPSGDIDPQELAEYVDNKMQELSTGSAKLSTLDLGVLTALNLAHELALVRQELATLKEDQESRQEEINQRVSSLVSQVKTGLA